MVLKNSKKEYIYNIGDKETVPASYYKVYITIIFKADKGPINWYIC